MGYRIFSLSDYPFLTNSNPLSLSASRS